MANAKPESQTAKGIAGAIGVDNKGNVNNVTDRSKPSDLRSRFLRGEIKIVDDDDETTEPSI